MYVIYICKSKNDLPSMPEYKPRLLLMSQILNEVCDTTELIQCQNLERSIVNDGSND
jgi:hypothetical protein